MSIAIFDLETTGIDPWNDRIVEVYINTGETQFHSLVNPLTPIPPDASAIHGITDERIQNSPPFREVASALSQLLRDKILLGYNSRRFDTIMLHQEFERAGFPPPFKLESVQEIDVLSIWRSVETQNLSSGVRRWLGRDHEGAHGAESDAMATWEIFNAIRKRYDLTTEECVKRSLAPRTACFKIDDEGIYRFAFGKHRGDDASDHPDYLEWMLANDFDAEAKRIAREVLNASRSVS